jgi:hypothetical protein
MLLTLESEAVEQLKASVTNAVVNELQAVFASIRWVSAATYAKYYDMSLTTLWRKEKSLRKAGALIGKGKRRRFDKFFKPPMR